MSKLSDLNSAAARLLGNMVLTKANAVIGATATAFTTGNAITTVIDGVMRTLAAQTNTALAALATADFAAPTSQAALNFLQPSGLTGFYVQPAGTTVYYALCVNSAGTVRVVQGTYDGQQLQAGLSAPGKSWIPDVPDSWAPFAVMKVVTAGSAFTPATTALTGLATFADVAILPSANTF